MKLINISVNKETSCIIFNILGKQYKLKSKKLMLKKQENLLMENLYAHIWSDTVINSDWFLDKSVTPTKGAANYSFLLLLYKILDELNPKNILEFGLGQTSKLTVQYVNNGSDDMLLDIVEHDADWINCFKKKLILSNNINIYQKDLIKFKLYDVESDKYDKLEDITSGKKYDLIIIDGPYGYNRKYPRTNILDLIPQNLNKNFVIILDDAERVGEQNTANLIFEQLKNNNIEYIASYMQGLKTQLLITSKNYKFIHWV